MEEKMKKILALLLLTTGVNAQDLNCPPNLQSMTTTRIPEFDNDGNETGNYITVSEADIETRSLLAYYICPYGNTIGAYTMNGTITYENKSDVTRRIRFRQSILLVEGIVPIIPLAFSEVCWEPTQRRLITMYEQVLDPGQIIEVPIFWEITTRLEGQLADVNGDGTVDATDQGLLMVAMGTNNPLYDLNQDGVVDAADLGILLSQWSETSDDIIEEANAGEEELEEPVEMAYNSAWETADHIMSADIEIDPMRGGNGQVRVPFLDWRWRS